ncbi:flagellar hook-basal body protein [Nitrosophilus kaiyonis]|uniref:flagellar hook-basal body protein n=1 Tax=Nitrosophilus kaiyonis TaxID=2930200 RepID=UPI002491CC44|nr:flagellar hook-basal body protein [Nitrosophilus kaiyonis]
MALNLQSIYVLASGSSRAMEQLDTITNNIANVNTTGFKKLLLKEMSQRIDKNRGDSNHLFVFSRFEDTPVILEQGSLKKTENPLDFAIEGDGFFQVKVKGEKLLTRNGHFFINNENILVDSNGNPVLDDAGKKIEVNSKYPINVGPNGAIFQKGEEVAKLKIINFEKVKAYGKSYYVGNGSEKKPKYLIRQGFLESSNVNPIKEMSEMIISQRRFEIYSNLIKSLDAIEQKTNEIGRA